MTVESVWNRLPLLFVCALGSLACGVSRAASSAAPTGQERAEAAGRGLVGSPAPRMTLKTIDGDVIDLGSLYGKKAVYLKFWATWCVPCREQMPHFEHAFETAGPDLAVIAINAGFDDTLEDVLTYRKRLGIKMPIVIDDGRLGAAFNLRVTPQHIVIGRDGRIQYVGHLADARLDAALLAARNGTVPVGSNVPAGGLAAGSTRIASGAAGAATAGDRAASGGALAAEGPKYEVGDRLPGLSATTLDGQEFRMRESGQGRRTVLVFLSPWCESYLATSRPGLAADCRSVREEADALARKGHERWLGIASGLWASRGELASYRQENKVTIPLTLDESGGLFRTFHVMNVPTVLVADGEGRIVRRLEGRGVNFSQELRELLAGGPAGSSSGSP